MNANFPYPSYDGSNNQWTMVAPQAYYGAQYDSLHAYHHQASLLQTSQTQHSGPAPPAYGAHAGYGAPAFAHGQAASYYPAAQPQYVASGPAVEPMRSRFAFAHAPGHYEQRFNLPPPAMHAYGTDEYMRPVETAPYVHAESAARATLESEHLQFLLGRLAQSADPSSLDDYDHPSHCRPPHRAEHSRKDGLHQLQDPITYDLIPNVSPVPPPPSIERSAVPLADLATEMVWEAARRGYLHAEEAKTEAVAPVNAGVIGQPSRNGPRRSGGAEQFGVIGSGRSRQASRDRSSMSSSSPASSMPGTPMGVEAVEDAIARRQRLADLGLASYDDLSKGGPYDAFRPRHAVSPFPVEPSLAFRQFVKQILTATLVTPEDLIYAIGLVSSVPLEKVIPPTPAEPGQDAQTTSFKAAPFKVFLGALMLANKQLQDNSYRNASWASVSAIPLPDVNALEAHVLLALRFDVAVNEETWAKWLVGAVERSRSGRGQLGDYFAVQDTLERLVRAAARNAPSVAPSSPVIPSTPASFTECPSTPLSSSVSSLNSMDLNSMEDDLDAFGPLESARRISATSAAAAAAPRPALQRPALGFPRSSQDSPLVGRSRSCRRASDFPLFQPMIGATGSRSFGQEAYRPIC
ncbi:hypothetical protein JCM11641_005765 [Rhodosporidiobolus odoratus]